MRQGIRLERKPIGIDDASQNARPRGRQKQGDEQVADQQPSPLDDSVRDDDDRKRECDHQQRAPEPRRPTEERAECLPDFLVGSGSRPSDHGLEPDQSGSGRDQDPVHRPPVSSTRLGRDEQRETPRT